MMDAESHSDVARDATPNLLLLLLAGVIRKLNVTISHRARLSAVCRQTSKFDNAPKRHRSCAIRLTAFDIFTSDINGRILTAADKDMLCFYQLAGQEVKCWPPVRSPRSTADFSSRNANPLRNCVARILRSIRCSTARVPIKQS